MRIGIVRIVMLANCRRVVPTEYSSSASDPLTSSSTQFENCQQPVISCIPTHQPLPQSAIAQSFLLPKKILKNLKAEESSAALPKEAIPTTSTEKAAYNPMLAVMPKFEGSIQYLQQHQSLCLLESRNLPPLGNLGTSPDRDRNCL